MTLCPYVADRKRDDPFYGTSGPKNARVVIIGDSYGKYDEVKIGPFLGPSGAVLTSMLAAAGYDREDCLLTNVVNMHPPGNKMWQFLSTDCVTIESNGLYLGSPLIHGLNRLWALLDQCRPDLIIGAGNWPLWALTNRASIDREDGYYIPKGVGKWAGSQLRTKYIPSFNLEGIPYLPITHPGIVLKQESMRSITVHDLKRGRKIFNGESWDRPNYDFTVNPTIKQVLRFLDVLDYTLDKRAELLIQGKVQGRVRAGIDLETTPEGLIRTIAIATSDREAICIPFLILRNDGSYFPYWEQSNFDVVHRRLRRTLSHILLEAYGQNFNFDLTYLTRYLQVAPRVRLDTMLAQHCLFPGTPKSLDMLGRLYCRHYEYWKDDLKDSNQASDDEGAQLYNCEDAVRTFEIGVEVEKTIEEAGLAEQNAFLQGYAKLCLQKSILGSRVDKAAILKKKLALLEEVTALRAWLEDVMPDEFKKQPKGRSKKLPTPWYASSKQTAEILYDKLGIKPILHKKTKRPTVDDTALVELINRNHPLRPVLEALQEYRSASVFLNTFLSAKLDVTGRMPTSYNPAGTETFRLSSSKDPFRRGLNLQNIPTNPDD